MFLSCLSVPGPCDPEDLIDGIIFAANYLGSTQLLSDKTPSKNVRMMQAQEAVSRIKVRLNHPVKLGFSKPVNPQHLMRIYINDMLIHLISQIQCGEGAFFTSECVILPFKCQSR